MGLPTVVGANGIHSATAAATSTNTLGFASTAGDILFFTVQWYGAVSVTSITDNSVGAANNYVLVQNGQTPVNSYTEAVYMVTGLVLPASGNLSITVNFSANFTDINVTWLELTGLSTYAGIDLLGNISAQITPGSQTPTSNLNLLANSEFLFAAWVSDNTSQGVGIGTGWTQVLNTFHKTVVYQTITGTAPYSTTVGPITIPSPGSQGIMIVIGLAFSPIAAPSPPVALFKNSKRYLPQGLIALQDYKSAASNGISDQAWIGATALDPGWLSPGISGVKLRVHWNDIQPTSAGSYDWTYLDWAFQAANQTGKIIGINVVMGVSSPSWVFTAGSSQFAFTGITSPAPPPWDTVFQPILQTFFQALLTRYGNNSLFSYIELSGMGRGNQAGDWCQSATDNTTLQTVAVANGYAPDDSGVAIWVAGCLAIAKIFYNLFYSRGIATMFTKGGPVYFQDPTGYFTALNQLLNTYFGFIGLKDNALTGGYHAAGQPMVAYFIQWSPTNPCGMQRNTAATGVNEWLNSVNHALGWGIQFIEIYPSEETLVGTTQLIATNTQYINQFATPTSTYAPFVCENALKGFYIGQIPPLTSP